MTTFAKFMENKNTPVKYIFLDLDGTLREHGTEGMAPHTIEAIKVFPWVQARIAEAIRNGFKPVGATNQARSCELFGSKVVEQCIAETLRQIGIDFPVIYAETREQCKPNTYMLDRAEELFGPADKDHSIFVGDDLQKDKVAAEKFGIKWISPEQFRDSGTK